MPSTPARSEPSALRISQRGIRGPARGVLVHGKEGGNADPFLEQLAQAVTGTLRRDHRHVDTSRRRDGAEVDVESVGKHQRLAGGQIRSDLLLVQTLLDVIRNQHHDHIGFSHRVGHGGDAQTVRLGLRAALASLVQPDDDVDAGIAKIEGMGMTLAAVTDDGHRLALERVESGVALVIDLRGHATSPVIVPAPRAALVARAHRPGFCTSPRSKSAVATALPTQFACGVVPFPATAISRSARALSFTPTVAEPRIMATGPVRTSSRMPKAFSMFSNPSMWVSGPVASISNVLGWHRRRAHRRSARSGESPTVSAISPPP